MKPNNFLIGNVWLWPPFFGRKAGPRRLSLIHAKILFEPAIQPYVPDLEIFVTFGPKLLHRVSAVWISGTFSLYWSYLCNSLFNVVQNFIKIIIKQPIDFQDGRWRADAILWIRCVFSCHYFALAYGIFVCSSWLNKPIRTEKCCSRHRFTNYIQSNPT